MISYIMQIELSERAYIFSIFSIAQNKSEAQYYQSFQDIDINRIAKNSNFAYFTKRNAQFEYELGVFCCLERRKMDWVIVDEQDQIIAEGFNTHKEALEYMKKMNLAFMCKTKLHIAERS